MKIRMLAVALAVASLTTAATGATVNFDALAPGALAPTASYTEGGFTFTVLSGTTFGGGDSNTVGNPGTAWWVGYVDAPVIGDTVSISRADNHLFTLDSLDYARLNGDGPVTDSVQFVGRLAGNTLETSAVLGSTSGSYQVFNTGFTMDFDEVRFVVAAPPGNASLLLDNMSFTVSPVPEPAAGLMLLGGLAVLGLMKRRQAA